LLLAFFQAASTAVRSIVFVALGRFTIVEPFSPHFPAAGANTCG
jgi:hypothetical protein